LTFAIAVENLFSKFRNALRVESHGFCSITPVDQDVEFNQTEPMSAIGRSTTWVPAYCLALVLGCVL
jgi:hypothetical protein